MQFVHMGRHFLQFKVIIGLIKSLFHGVCSFWYVFTWFVCIVWLIILKYSISMSLLFLENSNVITCYLWIYIFLAKIYQDLSSQHLVYRWIGGSLCPSNAGCWNQYVCNHFLNMTSRIFCSIWLVRRMEEWHEIPLRIKMKHLVVWLAF